MTLVLLGALALLGATVALARGPDPGQPQAARRDGPGKRLAAAQWPITPTDFITVTSTSDDGGLSERCETQSPCTLRRAINQVRWHSSGSRVFLIAFDLDTDDPGYDPDNEVWVFEVDSDNSGSEVYAYREFGTYGQVIIDGTTQPIGRDLADGPRIILRGDNNKGAFTLTGGDNVIRGLAFQGFGDRMVSVPGTSNNLVEDNWFGLTITGTGIYLRNPSGPEDGSGESGVYVQSGGDSNTIQDNVLVGFYGGAINLDSDDSFVLSNTVGTFYDGTAPQVRAERKCRPNARYYNWFPGAGVDVGGTNNLIAYNRIVGMLFMSADPDNTPDDALEVTGHDHVIRDNVIGLTSDGQPFGVCGEGIHIGGVSGAFDVQVLDNRVVGSRGEAAILITGGPLGYDLDSVTLQGNIIEDSANEAVDFGTQVPSELRFFKSAAVTSIVGTSVSGTSGQDSPCANCIIELFLDEIDTVNEALESLNVVTADGSGNWSATLPRTLAITEGIRTASTSVADGQIPHPDEPAQQYSAGMTAKLSELYVQSGAPDPTPPAPPEPEPPLPIPEPIYMDPPEPPAVYTTTIIVTSAADPDDSQSYTCYTDFSGPPEPAPDGVCTLRRAIIEATKAMEEDPHARPVHIQFDIPTSDPQYDDSAGVWIIQLTETLQLNALPTLGSTNVEYSGQVVIDGYSQPDHDVLRPDEPRIVLRSPSKVPAGAALVVNGEGNVIQGLAFQGFRSYLQINHGGSIIRDNWLGLTVDGQDIYLRDPDAPEDGSGLAGITIADNSSNHLIQDNRLAGFYGGAIDVQGDDSYILGNYVGTRVDGTIPEVPASRYCKPNARYYAWFGGAGIDVSGSRNQIGGPSEDDRNVVAGLLFMSADPDNTPDTAIDVYGKDHLIQNNYVGVDANGLEVGTCGRGIVVDASFTRIFSNTLYGVGIEAFRSSGTYATSSARYFQGNVVKESNVLLEYGNAIPEALSIFTPTQVITIDGTTVSGGDGHPKAPCPYCQVELFLDDLDEVPETLESLAVTTTDVNGDWTVILPRALTMDEGLRTVSTPLDYGVIENHEAGSSSRFSGVFSQPGSVPPDPPTPPDPDPPLPIPEPTYLAPPEPPVSYNTVVTVTTADDSNTSSIDTCDDVAADACSLRLAINQVEHLSDGERPVLIAFDIPISDDGYDPAGFWKITLSSTALPPVKGGQVTIDGSTQSGGRGDAPKIVLWRNSSTGTDLQLGETQFEGSHVVQGLAFQGVEISMTGDDNVIQDNWLGLSDDGTSMYFYNDDPGYENHAIIIVATDSEHNLVQNNRLAGSRTKAIDLKGSDDNTVRGNYVGFLADGTIDTASINFDNLCDQTIETDNWFGGGGLSIIGRRNQVINNTIAGLLIHGSGSTTPPDAIEAPTGQDSLFQHNRIGQDASGTDLWTCGSGMDIGSAYNRVLTNTIVSSFKEGIFVNGTVMAINANQLRGNVISNCVQAIEFGDAVPDELSDFRPALATIISGTDVIGISDDDCPFCWVDVYLDDDDGFADARAYLGSAIADVNGNWELELPAPLAEGEGLRTISTARDYGAIEKFEAGTSSKLSMLFTEQPPTPPSSVVIAGTETGAVGQPYSFVANVSPVTATLPITYVWQATGQDQQTVVGGVEGDVSFTWNSTGDKTITVTADNGWGSSVEDTHTITISEPGEDFYLYLPLVLRVTS
jgi:parallel beta-helix repeat protein